MEDHQLDGKITSQHKMPKLDEKKRAVDDDFHPASPLRQAIFAKVRGDKNMLYQQPDILCRSIEWLVEIVLRP